MRYTLYIIASVFLCAPLVAIANEAAVVTLDGCSGVCVSSDGLILTADHCGSARTVPVTFPDGSRFTARLVHSPPQNGIDEAQAYRIAGASRLPFAPVAESLPAAGDAVWSVGYPFGNYQMNRGRVRRIGFTTGRDKSFQVTLRDGVVTDWNSDGGNSGGPLFNESGEVIGLLSMSGGDANSYWIGLSSIETALTKQATTADAVTAYDRQQVVVFTTGGCAPCERLKADIRAGKLGSYEFHFVNWNAELRTWSDPELASDFVTSAKAPAGLGFPVIWVRGTDRYRVGYQPDRRGGLIGWLAGIFDGLGRLIIGEKPSPAFPPVDGTPETETPEIETLPTPVDSAMSAVSELKGDLLKAKADLERLKSANPLEKLRGVVALKGDVAEIKADAQTALSEVKAVKDDAKEKPLQYLWGLLGILSGLVHRRFSH